MEELQGLVDTLSRQLRVTLTPTGEDPAEGAVSGADLGADCGLVTSAEIVLRNEGPAIASRPSGWAIYFSSIRRVLSVDHAGFRVERLVGDLHRMEPTADFAGFGAGEEIVVPIVVEYWMLLATDVFPRWYIAGGAGVDLIPQVIASTDTEDPTALISDWPAESLRRGVDDRMVRSTPAGRLARYRSAPHPPPAAAATRPVPNVRDQTVTAGAFLDLTDGVRLCGDLPAADQLEVLAAAVQARGIPEGPIRIDLRVDPDGVEEVDRVPGGYRLKVATDGITIDGVDHAGLLNGMRCLLSLVPAPGRAPRLPVTTIHDAPRYGYRGLCLDAARHVISPPVIVSILEQMAALRMNVLHLRLSDDEGWRLEIPGLPELTEVGGRRRHGNDEHDGLLPQLGSGPDDSTSGSGWYTRDDYVAMVRAAAARGITIIPEFDMPAHARAAVVAMEARSRRLVDQGASPDEVARLRLTDPHDTTRLTTIQYYDNLSTLNPFVPGALTFVDEVIGAVASMHEEAGQPLRCWHYGGDEASNVLLGPGFSDTSDPIEATGIIDRAAQDEPWSGSPAVRQAVADGVVESPAEVPTWFAQRVAEVAQRHGVTTLQAWQDGFKHADGADDFSIAARVNLWETSFWGAPQSLPHQLSLGYEVVVTTPDYLYLDTPPELHELERGYYWAGRELDEQRVFSFAVENPAQNAELYPDRDGAPFAAESRALPTAPIGLSAAVFGELMRTEDQLYAALFPRLPAVAERAWYRPSWELPAVDGVTFRTGTTDFTDAVAVAVDFAGFTAAVGARTLPWLEQHGIPFRVPPPAARVSDGVLTMAAPYSGLTCQWRAASTDGDAGQWQDWSEDVRVGGTVQVRTRSDASGRTSRVESVADDGASADLDQKVLDAVAEGMQLEVTLLDNQAEHVVDAAALGAGWATVFTLEVTLRNESKATLPSRGWALHVPSIRRLLDVMGADIRLRHITGDHHVLEPGPGLPALAPGESMTFVLVGENFVLHRREILPRWYFSAPGLEPRVLAATDDENLGFVAPFAAANFPAREDDTTERVTGEVRYRRNAELDRVDLDDVAARVVPKPITTVRGEGWCDLAAGLDLTTCPTEVTEATRSWWQSRAAVLGLELSLAGGGGGTPLRVVIDASSLPDDICTAGGYRLDVASTGIDVTAADAAAAGHAMMTLFGLLPAPGQALRVPVCRIDDAPRYQHRALMLDIARNFRSVEYLRRLIDQLAAYKLNIFHLHLTDDEGWRLEIPGLPELTEVGARRGHTSDERDMLWAQLGSGPTPHPGGDFLGRARVRGAAPLCRSQGRGDPPGVRPARPLPCRSHGDGVPLSPVARRRSIRGGGGAVPADGSRGRLTHPDRPGVWDPQHVEPGRAWDGGIRRTHRRCRRRAARGGWGTPAPMALRWGRGGQHPAGSGIHRRCGSRAGSGRVRSVRPASPMATLTGGPRANPA